MEQTMTTATASARPLGRLTFAVTAALATAAFAVLSASAAAAPPGPPPDASTSPAIVSTSPARPGDVRVPPMVAAPADAAPATTVHSAIELAAVLRSPFQGRVIVPRDVEWQMNDPCGGRDELGRCAPTPLTRLPVRSGVQLVGERGFLGSRPVLHAVYRGGPYPLFVVYGNDVRVEGIHFRGPSRSTSKNQAKIGALHVIQDPVQQTGRRVIITGNEFDGWTDYGVNVCGNYGVNAPDGPGCAGGPRDPAEYTGPRITAADASTMRIERNYLHHNAREGAGYGVVISGNAYATIEGNVFDFNRHDITSDGRAYNGYVARFNYALQGGFTYGNGYWGQHFDVHGAGTAASREDGHYDGGPAGESYEIAFNTIRGEQRYGGFLGIATKTRAAFELRGRPSMGARFIGNVVAHDDRGEAVRLKRGSDPTLSPNIPASFKLTLGGNRYDTDYSTELATGDFDGDGRTDVFVANGTGWFFSRAAVQPWEYLRPSDKRVRDLAFADIDNDRITDVLYRDPAGNLGYVKSGSAADVTPLTSLPVPISDLRSGDFDGDTLTDLFHTRGGQWWIWYGRTRAWTPAQTSSVPVSGLLFGEFDDTVGTDVAAVMRHEWSYSSGGTRQWARLNGKLTNGFADAVAADFDGNGRTDIAFGVGGGWRFSLDGRGPSTVLRSGGGTPKQALIGRFDGGSMTMAVTFDVGPAGSGIATGERLLIWRGLGGPGAFVARSRQNMR
jgi:hypothetical protein